MKKEYLIYKLSEAMKDCTRIDNELFPKFDVKRGLRNEDGTGVLVGLTKIGNVVGYERIPGGGLKPIPGKLFYRGYDLEDLAHAILKEKRFGFEEVAYLLLSGSLPDKEELASFRELINDNMPLEQKTKMNIIELEGNNIMNILARSVLEMYRFDPNPDDTSRDNLMRQSIDLISKFPTIIAYAFNMLRHATFGRSLHIRHPQENLSIAENFLYMLKRDYTELDARTLDLLLVLQAEHGGGNNSTFTVRVTSSTGTDTYSAIAAGIGSLKGPLHGGANIQVADMFHHLQENIQDWTNVDEIDTYFTRMLNKEVYNKTGLIYGIGHAVYTISDPRAVLLKELARDLAHEKGREREFADALASGKLVIKDCIADAFLQNTLLIPEEYSVIATLNLNGDYISDQLAAMVGGIGIAPGANINYDSGHAIFEATHGTAPNIAGKNVVNPCSLILSAVMMLEYIGWQEPADLIVEALEASFAEGKATNDLARFMHKGQPLSTSEFTREIINRIKN